jgi:hypothetical protein
VQFFKRFESEVKFLCFKKGSVSDSGLVDDVPVLFEVAGNGYTVSFSVIKYILAYTLAHQ